MWKHRVTHTHTCTHTHKHAGTHTNSHIDTQTHDYIHVHRHRNSSIIDQVYYRPGYTSKVREQKGNEDIV